MSGRLESDVVVVTGGSSGIGRAICDACAAEGAAVVVADVREEPRTGGRPTAERVADEHGVDAVYVECDVTDRGDHEAAMDAAAELGGIDVMVNNAGIFRAEAFLDVTGAEFDRIMAVNVKGTFFGAQAAAGRMLDSGGGRIVNLSSIAGLQGTDRYVTYCASKGAVRLLTYALADRLGPEVGVNAVHPGIVETSMTTEDVPIVGTEAGERYEQTIPAGRFARPEDVADAVVFLASEESEYVTGESLVVDGGIYNTG